MSGDIRDQRQLGQAIEDRISDCLSVKIMVIAHQVQLIDPLVFLDVLENISVG